MNTLETTEPMTVWLLLCRISDTLTSITGALKAAPGEAARQRKGMVVGWGIRMG